MIMNKYTILCILPKKLNNEQTNQCIRNVMDQFCENAKYIFFSEVKNKFHNGKVNIVNLKLLEIYLKKDPEFLITSHDSEVDQKKLKKKINNIFIINKQNLLILQSPWISKKYLPNFDNHIFGKFGERMGGGLRYFPYGFFTQNPGMGIQDSFGHRFTKNLNELKNRKRDHFVIAIFGGSGAYGNNVSRSEMFSNLLEEKLNDDTDLKGFKKFSILNFSQQGALIINQLISYQLYCFEIRPNLVISHDGWNDLINGSISDLFLLKEYKISYLKNLENWAMKLQNVTHLDNKVLVNDVNPLHLVVNAFIDRKLFFKKIVENLGSTFLAVLQPVIYQKKEISKEEEIKIQNEIKHKPELRKLYHTYLPLIYEKTQSIHRKKFKYNLDFQNILDKSKTNINFFEDHVHLSKDGERIVAKVYYEKIKRIISK